jgi:hypothetical protein
MNISMKSSIFLILTLLFTVPFGCEDIEPAIDQVPDNIIPTKTCPTLYSRIFELFPESGNNELRQAVLFSDSVTKNVLLTSDTEVYITFLSEGASLRNTFGWYAYDSLTPPQSPRDFEWHVLFPNVSDNVLTVGDRLQLSDKKFKKGTVIGFFLIVGGWRSGTIDYSKPTHFTNYTLNADRTQQHTLFEEKTCGDIVLAFEDLSVNDPTCDRDFNDIIFTISDNNSNLKNSSFDQRRLVKW